MEHSELYSPTRLELFERCGMQFYFRYLADLIIPPAARAAWGGAGHATMQHHFDRKEQRGIDVPLHKLTDVFSDTLDNRFVGVEPRHYGDRTPKRKLKGKLKDSGIRMLTMFHAKIAPRIRPRKGGVEAAIQYTVRAEGEQVRVVTHMDVVTARGLVIDHKWTGKTPEDTATVLDNGHQGVAYYLAHQKLTGRKPREVRFDYYVDLKRGPRYAPRSYKSAKWRVNRFFRRLDYMQKAIRSGNFHPAAPGAWWCSKRWCGYWSRCKYGGKR